MMLEPNSRRAVRGGVRGAGAWAAHPLRLQPTSPRRFGHHESRTPRQHPTYRREQQRKPMHADRDRPFHRRSTGAGQMCWRSGCCCCGIWWPTACSPMCSRALYITFVTGGGDVTRSSIISGYSGLLREISILVGHTQPQDKAHRFALDIGPFKPVHQRRQPPLTCEPSSRPAGTIALNKQEGVSLPVGGFFNNQRLENIYDGPSYREFSMPSSPRLRVSSCPPDGYNGAGGCIYGSGQASGILKKHPTPNSPNPCYLPNAAIAWKQPNGFFEPRLFTPRTFISMVASRSATL